jgi:hypothetical protein
MPRKRAQRTDAVCEPQTGRIVLGGPAPIVRHTAYDPARRELELAITRYEAGDAAGAGSHIKHALRLDPALNSHRTRNAGRKRGDDGGVDARRYALHLQGIEPDEIAKLTPTKRGKIVKISTIESSISEAKRLERERAGKSDNI